MSEQAQTEARAGAGVLTDSIDRLWNEIKQISKQVEGETRRSGRMARLRLDIRKLEREVIEVRGRLGKAVYEARTAAGDDLTLHEVEGLAGGVAALDTLHAQIAEKEAEIAGLREGPAESAQDQATETPEEVAEEPVSG